MHMKYFQSIARIEEHYDRILYEINSGKGESLLKTWGINISEKESIIEEKEVLRYLTACQLSMSHNKNVKKPLISLVERCFNRHLFFLEKIHGCNAFNVNKHPSKLVQKEYKACRHYLFQFSLNGWYDKLPNEILTLENQYPEGF